jgi:hypothetical protein
MTETKQKTDLLIFAQKVSDAYDRYYSECYMRVGSTGIHADTAAVSKCVEHFNCNSLYVYQMLELMHLPLWLAMKVSSDDLNIAVALMMIRVSKISQHPIGKVYQLCYNAAKRGGSTFITAAELHQVERVLKVGDLC